MSNNPSHDRGGRRPAPRAQPPLSLSQVGRDEAPLLIPISPSSTIDEITRLVREAGAARVELLVPDGTSALQSIAGNETLREAAKAAGVRVTLFTADEKTTHAARFAKLDVVSVGGTVAAPRPGETPRRPTGQRPAVQPPTPPITPRPPQQQPTTPSAARPARPGGSPAPTSDSEFLTRLEAFDRAGSDEPPRVRQSDEGALLYDVPGDIGVQRPAQNDDEWQAAFGELDRATPRATFDDLAPPPADVRRPQPMDDLRPDTPRPSLLGALLGVLPQRNRRASAAVPPEDDGMRMSRPERTAEEEAARRRQSRMLTLGPLAAIALIALVGVLLLVWALGDSFNVRSLLTSASLGGAPTLTLEPPLRSAEAQTFGNQVIPLVAEPVNDPSSINVQGVVLTAPVTVTVQGTAAKTGLVPIGFAHGSVTIRNTSSQAVTIPAGTVVPANDQEFVFDADVTVPGSVTTDVGTTFGVAEATLTARNPGAQGNIPPGAIRSIPGFTGNQGPLRVAQGAAFTGGTDQEVKIVSPDDVSALLPQALSQVYGRGVQSLQSQLQTYPGFAMVSSETTPEITPTQELLKNIQPGDYSVFPPIGQVTQDGNFTLQIFRRFEALAGPIDKPIDQQVQRAVANLLRSQGRDPGNADVRITSWRRGNQGLIVDATVTPRGGYQQVSEQQRTEIQQAIAGKPRAEAEAYLQQRKADGTIGDFRLPPDWQTVPANVNITFAEPQPSR